MNNLKKLEEELAEHYLFRRFNNFDKIYFTDLSDIHIGHKDFDEETFKKTVDIIAQHPNFFVFLGGDSFNHASKGSKSSAFEENLTPREQVLRLEKLIAPIKDRVLGKIDGNHDGTRGIEFNDFSISEWFCDRAGIRYFKEFAIIQFSVNKNAYTHFFFHRSGSTGKKLNLNKIQEEGEKWRTDVVWGEHTHKRHWASELYVDVDLRNQKPIIREQFFVNANTFLSWGGYARDFGYRINKTGINIVEMSGERGNRYIDVMTMEQFLKIKKNPS